MRDGYGLISLVPLDSCVDCPLHLRTGAHAAEHQSLLHALSQRGRGVFVAVEGCVAHLEQSRGLCVRRAGEMQQLCQSLHGLR